MAISESVKESVCVVFEGETARSLVEELTDEPELEAVEPLARGDGDFAAKFSCEVTVDVGGLGLEAI